MRVPLVDLVSQQREIADEIRAELAEVFDTGAFIGGPAVTAFEREYAAVLGAGHCVGVANGTDALELALRAAGVDAGGEVILPANTFIATAEAVARIGAVPVLVDVDADYLLIDPDRVADAVSERTQAVVPVHLFGQVAPVERIIPIARSCGATVVEDAAQAQGARRFGQSAGVLGDAAGTSFYPGKNLGAAGDAGAVTTDDPELARRVRLLGAHGSERKYVHETLGFNSRLDTVQAVVLRAKLRRLAGWNDRRRAAAERYTALLADLPEVVTPTSAEGNEDVWHLYVVRVPDRDLVLERLHGDGIGSGIHYPTPVHLTDAFASLKLGVGAFPIAEQSAGAILSLPIFPHITEDEQRYVVDSVRAAVRGRG